ncbi:hypothetical protein [Polyangium sp. y55x31]|uniref:hypothetical protein n=1 Tax=Polyangium sp. y55x31 TaxID=3042688 RepID=UPI0024823087|nr:hypothetical protein [Polyangium sp. y55x31]MDI1483649.1 hypothetical protein [Polyangium sp. y55x31]
MRVRPANLVCVFGALACAGATGCAAVFGIEEGVLRPTLEVSGSIGKDTTWYADQTTILTGYVVVESGATLTIEPGTKILAHAEAGILVRQGARIVARGTKEAPIVFTSVETERAEGDWRGLVLCGRAPINGAPDGRCLDFFPPEIEATCGGTAEDDSSGELRFVRIEFAGRNDGWPGSPGGLRLEGVGSGTVVDHVQLHRTEADAIDLRGGTVSVKYILVTGYEDDGFDWALGWRGKGQFIGIVMGDMQGDTCIQAGEGTSDAEVDGAGTAPSDPLLYNVTAVGMADQFGPNLKLRGGTRGRMFDMLVANAGKTGLAIDETKAHQNANAGFLDIRHSIFANDDNFEDGEADFAESEWATDAMRKNRALSADESGLPLFTNGPVYLSLTSGAEGLSGAIAPPDDGFFDPTALFVGACGEVCPDFEGWTAFPDR